MKPITIPNQISPSLLADMKKNVVQEEPDKGFGALLKNSINEINHLHKEADKAVVELASGNKKNIHQTMIALEKADVSFQLMMQVRNKIIEAYNEVKRMQV